MKKKINFLLIIIIFSLLCTNILIKKLNKNVMPLLFSFSEEECKKIITSMISETVKKQISENEDLNNLYSIEKDDNEIKLLNYNTIVVNRILTKVTQSLQDKIKKIENSDLIESSYINTNLTEYNKNKIKKGIIYEIPVFVMSNNIFLSNLGPKVPLKLSFLGDVNSRIQTKITEYGINNALLQLGIYVEVTIKINLPFVSKIIKIKNVVPLSINVIEGVIPEAYINGISYPSIDKSVKID